MTNYQKFQERMRNVTTDCGYSSKDVAALKYKQLLEEVLEQFKLLEDSLEWRKKVEEAREWGDDDDSDYFESDEEREEWNELMMQKIIETKTNEPCHYLVQKILKNNPQVVNDLFQLLSNFKFKTEEGIGEKE